MGKDLQLNNLIFTKTDKVILALSGGRDSMTLLDLLTKNNYQVIVCHINHQKRKESDMEESYIKNYCQEHKIVCEIAHFTSSEHANFQALAHNFRYDFFYETAKKYQAKYILTAHQADDLAETILLRLITGSNLYGYGGISKLVSYKDVFLYRPMLEITRDQINEYVKTNNIVYFEDDSNNHDDYLRNRIRHHILPLLKAENPNFLAGMVNYSTILKESFAYIRKNTLAFLNNEQIILVEEFKKLDIAIKKDVLSYLLEQKQIKPTSKLIADLINLVVNPKPQLDYNLAQGYLFVKRYNEAYIKKAQPVSKEMITLSLGEKKSFSGKYWFYLTKNISNINAKHMKIWYNKATLPLTIRTRQVGDYLAFNFGKKKLKDYFIDKKIEKEKRDAYPLILDNTGNIIAIYTLLNLSKGDDYIYLVCEVKDE